MTNLRTVPLFDVHTLIRLYRTYAEDLRAAREAQRELLVERTLKPKLDDIEAELTYLALRETRPAAVVEIGSFHGWSTTWILRALRDNGSGHLYTFDLVDHATRAVPAELAGERWTFVPGDVRETAHRHLPPDPATSSSTRCTPPASPAGTPAACSHGSPRVRRSACTTCSTAGARGRTARAAWCSPGCASAGSGT
jgi:Methyltransferase domain